MAKSDDDLRTQWRHRLLAVMITGILVSTAASFVESFFGQIGWFAGHDFPGWRAWIAPTMIDIFIVAGEVLLLLAVIEHWDWAPHAAGWAMTLSGLATSVAANVGHVWARSGAPTKLSHAAPPLALAGLMAAGLMILKRYLARDDPGRAPASPDVPAEALEALAAFAGQVTAGTVPGHREIRRTLGCGSARTSRTQVYLTKFATALARPPAPETATLSNQPEVTPNGSTSINRTP